MPNHMVSAGRPLSGYGMRHGTGAIQTGRRRVLQVALVALVAGGCKSTPPPPAPTVVRGTIRTFASANPAQSGRPSPVVVRLYELKSTAAFDTADFFTLFDKDQATLGADLAGKDEVTLPPGESKPFERRLQPGSRYIAVVVAFSQIERARWRATVAIPEAKTTDLSIEVGAHEVTLKTAPVPAPKR